MKSAATLRAPVSEVPSTSSHDPRRARAAVWLILPAIALAELLGHVEIAARVPSESDVERATQFVRSERRDKDLLVAAPEWSEPILRKHAKDMIGVTEAGRADTEPFERLWVFSTRGHAAKEAPARNPDFSRSFGRVHLSRWDLGPTHVLEDLVSAVRPERASVEILQQGAWNTCGWETSGAPSTGGLHQGAFFPPRRFSCPGAPP